MPSGIVFNDVNVKGWPVDTLDEPPIIDANPGASYAIRLIDASLEVVRIQGQSTTADALRVSGSTVERRPGGGSGA